MEILTIGSGDMWSINHSASYLINQNILLDIPNGTCRQLKKMNIDIKNINHVIITHLHADHFFDLPFYLFNNSDSKSIIYCKSGDEEKILQLIDISFPNARKYINVSFNTNDQFRIGEVVIERIEVSHGDEIKSFGYIISDKNTKVGFTGDTCLCEAVKNMADQCDLLICDCTLIKGNNFHMGIDDLNYLSQNQSCDIYASHIKDETRKHIINDNFQALSDGKKLVLHK